jgi:tetratricopeptide (TPR) repeat protein
MTCNSWVWACFLINTKNNSIFNQLYLKVLDTFSGINCTLLSPDHAELWTNLGLCCFYSSQYDMCLGCLDQALRLADDSSLGDIWYNIGQVTAAHALKGRFFEVDLSSCFPCISICNCKYGGEVQLQFLNEARID